MKAARLKVLYESKDISEDISRYLISFNLNDNLTDRADDISISLDNSTGIWINDWYPTKGTTLDISLLLDYDNIKKEIKFGKFNIDELSITFNPNILTIKAITALLDTGFKEVLVTNKVRENISIKQLVEEIGKKHGFEVEYKADVDYVIKWIIQKDQSDSNFLYKTLSKYGLFFKVTDKRIVVYEGFATESVLDISNYSSLSVKEKTHDIYTSVKLTYRNPKKSSKNIDYTYTDDTIKTGKQLIIESCAESISEAELIAKAELKKRNSRATTGSLSMIGVGEIYSGQKISLKDVGVYSGEYKVEKVTHNLSRSGYTNNVEFISL